MHEVPVREVIEVPTSAGGDEAGRHGERPARDLLEQAVVHLPFTQSPTTGADCSPVVRRPFLSSGRHLDPRTGLMDITVIIFVVVVTALAFDFTNGFHDTANAVAT